VFPRRHSAGFSLVSVIGTFEPSCNFMKLSAILRINIIEELNTDGSMGHGVYMLQVNDIRIPLLIMELKGELGDGDCDPSLK